MAGARKKKAVSKKEKPRPEKKTTPRKKVSRPRKSKTVLPALPNLKLNPKIFTRLDKTKAVIEVPQVPAVPSHSPGPSPELPGGYGDNSIRAMVRDPYWTFTYWEIRPDHEESKLRELGSDRSRIKSILRVYNLSASPEHRVFFDIVLRNLAMQWYIGTEPNTNYVVEIGLLHDDGRFVALARSNEFSAPRDGMSDVIDEEWMGIDFDKMYALSGGFQPGQSSLALREFMEKKMKESISSGSGGSSFSGGGKTEEKGFWFLLDCEVVVYGAAAPGATVTIQGKPVAVRPDGSFTARFALPDGKLILDASAVSADNTEIRKIIPVIDRRTERPAPQKFKTQL